MKINELIGEAKTIALGGHVKPDGDCLGSVTAVYKYINLHYPQVIVDAFIEEPSNDLMYLIPEGFFQKKNKDDKYDLFIALDAADFERLGSAKPIFEKAHRTLCIDHHSSNPGYADVNIIKGDIGSASEVLFELLDYEKIDKSIAVSIYTGMVHDTGVFQYKNTTPSTLRIAAQLMEFDFDFSSIIEDSFYSKTFLQNKLLGLCLSQSTLELDNRCIISAVSKSEYESMGAVKMDFEGIVSQLRYTKEAEVAVLLYEMEDNCWKASMRSKGRVNLIPIAALNNGGGHILAAGCTLYGTKEEACSKLLEDIKNNL